MYLINCFCSGNIARRLPGPNFKSYNTVWIKPTTQFTISCNDIYKKERVVGCLQDMAFNMCLSASSRYTPVLNIYSNDIPRAERIMREFYKYMMIKPSQMAIFDLEKTYDYKTSNTPRISVNHDVKNVVEISPLTKKTADKHVISQLIDFNKEKHTLFRNKSTNKKYIESWLGLIVVYTDLYITDVLEGKCDPDDFSRTVGIKIFFGDDDDCATDYEEYDE